jgi:putative transposase
MSPRNSDSGSTALEYLGMITLLIEKCIRALGRWSGAWRIRNSGRICLGRKRINFSTVFPGQALGTKEMHKKCTTIFGCLVDYDLGYFDLEPRVLEPLENPFGPKVLPMS